MTYIKHYWNDKENRAIIAKDHTLEMDRKYSKEIRDCIANTKVYNPDHVFRKKSTYPETNILIKNSTTTGDNSVLSAYNKGITILNFASYKNPGGMFINGSKAQEECICHDSFLYNVLKEFPDYYEWNSQHKNKALYLNRALYSPNVLVNCDNEYKPCNVITCAAPNKSAAQKYANITDKENYSVLQSRIKFVLDVAAENDTDTLILGAYGCGVFGQDPREVANVFKYMIETYHKNSFATIVFAIPEGRDGNLKAFRDVYTTKG